MTLNQIARVYKEELIDGIAWVILYKKGRSWYAEDVYGEMNPDGFIFDHEEDAETLREISAVDPNAVMINGYELNGFFEDSTLAGITDSLRWHYELGCYLLADVLALTGDSEQIGDTSYPVVYAGTAGKDEDAYSWRIVKVHEAKSHFKPLYMIVRDQGAHDKRFFTVSSIFKDPRDALKNAKRIFSNCKAS